MVVTHQPRSRSNASRTVITAAAAGLAASASRPAPPADSGGTPRRREGAVKNSAQRGQHEVDWTIEKPHSMAQRPPRRRANVSRCYGYIESFSTRCPRQHHGTPSRDRSCRSTTEPEPFTGGANVFPPPGVEAAGGTHTPCAWTTRPRLFPRSIELQLTRSYLATTRTWRGGRRLIDHRRSPPAPPSTDPRGGWRRLPRKVGGTSTLTNAGIDHNFVPDITSRPEREAVVSPVMPREGCAPATSAFARSTSGRVWH